MKKNTVYKTIAVILDYCLFQISRFFKFWRLLRRNFVIHFYGGRSQLTGCSFNTASKEESVIFILNTFFGEEQCNQPRLIDLGYRKMLIEATFLAIDLVDSININFYRKWCKTNK